MKRFNQYLLTAIFILFGFTGCLKDYHKEKLEKELAILNQYLEDNNIDVLPKPTGLYYIENEQGSGIFPELGDYLLFTYTARLLENNKVIATSDEVIAQENNFYNANTLYGPYKMEYGYITPYGVHEGLSYMREGGKATLIFPVLWVLEVLPLELSQAIVHLFTMLNY